MDLGEDAQTMIKEPDIEAVKFVPVNVHSNATGSPYEPLFRNQGTLDCRRLSLYPANPEAQAFISGTSNLDKVRVHVIQRDAWHNEMLDGSETTYLGRAARFRLNPAYWIW